MNISKRQKWSIVFETFFAGFLTKNSFSEEKPSGIISEKVMGVTKTPGDNCV
jgi:hypothetical protein